MGLPSPLSRVSGESRRDREADMAHKFGLEAGRSLGPRR